MSLFIILCLIWLHLCFSQSLCFNAFLGGVGGQRGGYVPRPRYWDFGYLNLIHKFLGHPAYSFVHIGLPRQMAVCIQLTFIGLCVFTLNSCLFWYLQISTTLLSALWLPKRSHLGSNGFKSSLKSFFSEHIYHFNPLLLSLCKEYTIFLLCNWKLLI